MRDGYKFKEWNTKADGTGTPYADEQVINKSSNITLYAIWKSETGTITFNSNYDDNQTKIQTFTFNVNTKLQKNTFTRDGYNFVNWNTESNGTGDSYTNEETIIFDKSLVLYAQWQDVIPYTVNNYEVDKINNYISKIMVNTEYDTFKSNITLGSGYTVNIDYKEINNKKILYTGGKTKIMHNTDLYKEFTNVVIGDINGDGKINSADLLKIRQHLLGTNVLNGAYFLSSDINYDNTINSADLLRVRQHLLGSKLIK